MNGAIRTMCIIDGIWHVFGFRRHQVVDGVAKRVGAAEDGKDAARPWRMGESEVAAGAWVDDSCAPCLGCVRIVSKCWFAQRKIP